MTEPQPPSTSPPAPAPPSPPAPPPPEGVRASTLRKVFDKALHSAIKQCSYHNFEKCFPTTAKNNPALLKAVWQQITQHWSDRAKNEYELIIQSRHVVEKLNELDVLEKEAKKRKDDAPEGYVPVAPSTLPPVTVVGAHLTPLLQEAMGNVNGRIEGVKAENMELARRIEEQNREMDVLRQVLESKMEEMQRAVDEVVGALREEDGDEMVGVQSTQ